ncbi:MAG: hypothetical protein CMP47_14660 [Rickettsiales bacterium]|nr:hypothetical protein [Rickettsiales bacterium]
MEIRMKLRIIAGLVAASLVGSVSASDVSYDNLTLSWNDSTIDGDGGSDLDLDGFGAGVSFSLNKNWYMALDTTMLSGNEGGVDADLDISTVNFGFHNPISNNTDFIAELGYAKADSEATFAGVTVSDDESAANLVLGFRGMATENFEWGASVQHMDFDDSTTFLNLEGRYYLADNFSLGLTGKFESDINIYALEARFDF